MELGMIGLDRMGGSMVQRQLQAGHRVVNYDRQAVAVQASHVGPSGTGQPAQPFGGKLLAAIRRQFGGQAVRGSRS